MSMCSASWKYKLPFPQSWYAEYEINLNKISRKSFEIVVKNYQQILWAFGSVELKSNVDNFRMDLHIWF